MNRVFHITSGDIADGSLAKAGLPGEVFVWHDILYGGTYRNRARHWSPSDFHRLRHHHYTMRKDLEFQSLRALQRGLLFLPDKQEAGRIQTACYRNWRHQTAGQKQAAGQGVRCAMTLPPMRNVL